MLEVLKIICMERTMQKEMFLSQHNISDSDLEEAKIGWDELELIVKEYEKVNETLHVDEDNSRSEI